jgi:hypothetical protein
MFSIPWFPATDTTYINFLEPLYDASNILTRNGAVHFLNHVLFVYRPPLSPLRFEFYEEPHIFNRRNSPNTYILTRETPLTRISWEGPDQVTYYKSSTAHDAENNDYIQIDGDFTIHYQIPRVLPGSYRVELRAHSNSSANALVEIMIDGRKIGGTVNLTTGGTYRVVNLGTINFANYEPHLISVKSILPGRFIWDYIQFVPN